MKTKWWKYLLMGLTDVQANYAVVKAYQYTTLTSIQVSSLTLSAIYFHIVCRNLKKIHFN